MSTNAKYSGILTGIVAFIALFITLLVSLGEAEDLSNWVKVDDKGRCYILIEKQRNLWFTPGKDTETRTTYCKEKN